jgi:DNA primase
MEVVPMTNKPSSAKFIDFQHLKQAVKIDSVFLSLGLQLKQSGEQWRGTCPACKAGGDRALVITPAKSAFYCFAAQQGGDVIALVSHLKGLGMKDSASWLAEQLGPEPSSQAPTSQPKAAATVPEKEKAGFNPLTYLQVEHPAVQGLGLSPETALHFGAGFAPRGILRGRLAIPIHDRHGTLVAYCGRAIKGESPALIFPNGFNPADFIFGAQLVQSGHLALVRDPLSVMVAYQSGVENVVAFLTEAISAQQLEMLSSLMDERHCETVELF